MACMQKLFSLDECKNFVFFFGDLEKRSASLTAVNFTRAARSILFSIAQKSHTWSQYSYTYWKNPRKVALTGVHLQDLQCSKNKICTCFV